MERAFTLGHKSFSKSESNVVFGQREKESL